MTTDELREMLGSAEAEAAEEVAESDEYTEELENDLDEARELLADLVDYVEAILKKNDAGQPFLSRKMAAEIEEKVIEARMFDEQWVDVDDSETHFA